MKAFLITLALFLLAGCDFLKNSFSSASKTEELVEAVLKEDYDRAIKCFALDHESARNTNFEALRAGMADFRVRLVSEFGTDLDFRLMQATKRWSTTEGGSTPSNATLVFIEFENGKDFGVLKVLFDDTSGKILNINLQDAKEPIPSMKMFWLFGLLVVGVLAFNIYVIRLVKRCNFKRKWPKYLAIVALNTPTLTYAAVGGLTFKLINLQLMLGISFSFMGYTNTAWTVGLPLGGLYWFFKVRVLKRSKPSSSVVGDQTDQPGM